MKLNSLLIKAGKLVLKNTLSKYRNFIRIFGMIFGLITQRTTVNKKTSEYKK
jgi:hypothetical protein